MARDDSTKETGSLEALAAEAERWREETWQPATAKHPERRARFETPSGLELEPTYTAADWPPSQWVERLGFPGEYPFTRGVQPTMYRGRHWTMRQYAGFGTAEESNARYRYLLSQGTTGLSVAFDLPTQMGRDSDHARAQGEVGRVGVAIDTADDMATLMDGIPLGEVSTSMTINATAAILLALYQVQGRRTGVGPRPAPGHHPERRAQGVHGPGHLHLPAGAGAADHHRHLRLRDQDPAEVQHHLHQRLPHPRGGLDGGAGGGLHPGRRDRLRGRGPARGPRGRRVRRKALVLLQRPQPLPRGDRQVPGGPEAVGAGS